MDEKKGGFSLTSARAAPLDASGELSESLKERYVGIVSALDALLEDLIDLGTSIGIQPESMPTFDNDISEDSDESSQSC